MLLVERKIVRAKKIGFKKIWFLPGGWMFQVPKNIGVTANNLNNLRFKTKHKLFQPQIKTKSEITEASISTYQSREKQ